MQLRFTPCGQVSPRVRGRQRLLRDPGRLTAWTGPNDGAVSVANTIGWVTTEVGTPLSPPAAPARSRCHMSAPYSREHGSQAVARRLPHLTYSTPSGRSAESTVDITTPLPRSTVCARPTSFTGR